jgi:hypothetical protein
VPAPASESMRLLAAPVPQHYSKVHNFMRIQ